MQAGLTNQAMLLRRHMLEHNGDEIVRRMNESGFDNPVGLIVEMTDDIGKSLAYAAMEAEGIPKYEIPELIAKLSRDAIPTFLCVFDFEDAKRLMARTSDSAEKNFGVPRKPGTAIVVVIAGGGNTYAHVPLS